MKKHGLRSKMRRKFKITTDSHHNYPVSPDLINQNFAANQINKVWVSDITYVRTLEGWLYLTVVPDVFNRRIVGWSMSSLLTTLETTLPAIQMAYRRYKPNPESIFHSDRGVQKACDVFREQLNQYQMLQSMSGKGNCYDNAITESFFSTLKKELVYHHNFKTCQEASLMIFQYIEMF